MKRGDVLADEQFEDAWMVLHVKGRSVVAACLTYNICIRWRRESDGLCADVYQPSPDGLHGHESLATPTAITTHEPPQAVRDYLRRTP